MPKPSVIIDPQTGVRHTGHNCPVQRKRGYCRLCARLASRMPPPSESRGSPQRSDIPMRTDGDRMTWYLTRRSDMKRLATELDRRTPYVIHMTHNALADNIPLQRAILSAGHTMPSAADVYRNRNRLRAFVKAQNDMCYTELEGMTPREPDDVSSGFFAGEKTQ